ncbi:MAG: hypothetical protein D6689_20505 [Deltaproteobacteria bacterium]|nr:MAG: hypothetical protein D6689_20505 [Deltaproteobacteria bacterium]
MRIACVYLPSYPLQVLMRRAPHLTRAPAAVSDTSAVGARLALSCVSRAAWEAGVRPGMTPQHARRIAGDLVIEPADPAAERGVVEALADALLTVAPAVDVGADGTRATHKALFVAVPSGARGSTFGDRLLQVVNRQGLRARIGIADDRFTAWAAAAVVRRTSDPANADLDAQSPVFAQTVTSVPRGGAAAFLAPLPMALLPLDDDVRRMLVALRVRTIGDFAALPPPTVARRTTAAGVDVHALARGAGPAVLRRYEPSTRVTERLDLGGPHAATGAELAPVLYPLADRVCERLRGRRRAASGLRVILRGAASRTVITVALPTPTASARALTDALRPRVDAARVQHAVDRVVVEVVADAEPSAAELDLFAPRPHRRTRRGKRDRRRTRQQALPLAGS